MTAVDVELFQFLLSPYNEKVRWALDVKQIPHKRTTLVPGPHRGRMLKLTGQTKTPVLRIGERYIVGSARIVDELERLYPTPALYPQDPSERERALEIQRHFDEDLAPRIRRAALSVMMDHGMYFSKCFGGGLLYGLLFPLVRSLVKKGNGITDAASIEDGVRAAQEALDFVSVDTGSRRYLVGDRFTVADLTVAAHLAPCIDPPHKDTQRPTPYPRPVADWLASWRAHSAATWVLEMYERHRR